MDIIRIVSYGKIHRNSMQYFSRLTKLTSPKLEIGFCKLDYTGS